MKETQFDDHEQFKALCDTGISNQGKDTRLKSQSIEWVNSAARHNYSYHFEWLGRPIIQHPQDMIAVQEILWQVQPDLVIETGIARGGSLVYTASLLELIATCGGPKDSSVLGIDIDIRQHNEEAILKHPMGKRIQMLQGSSIDKDIVKQVIQAATGKEKVVVFLDSNHTHDHVLEELRLYSPLVTRGSYMVVFDTIVEYMPDSLTKDRSWGRGNNPLTAVYKFMEKDINSTQEDIKFEIDESMDNKLLISVAPHGFLKRTK